VNADHIHSAALPVRLCFLLQSQHVS